VPKPKPDPEEKRREELRRGTQNYMKYSGMAFQMIAILLAFILGGRYLDGKFGTEPYLLLVGCFLGIGLALYLPLKDLMQK
jgi:F0F1-type ATP synthase assembly protein I